MPEINKPEIVAQVTAAFERYDEALKANDVDTINELFWDHDLTLRYGPNGQIYGGAALAAFRRNRVTSGVERTLIKAVIATFGDDFATANAEYAWPGNAAIGRQSQTWVRMEGRWRIVAAHVSDFAPGAP